MEQEYEYTPLYYEHPVQVKYYDPQHLRHREGIAFHNYIVRALDGYAFKIDDIIESGQCENLYEDFCIVEQDWLNFEPAIH